MIKDRKVAFVNKKSWCCDIIANGIKIWIFYSLISSTKCSDEFDIDNELHTNDLIATLFRLSRYRNNPSSCNDNFDCHGRNEHCDLKTGLCVCLDYHVRIENTMDCEMCPGEDKPCAIGGCCMNKYYQCIDGYCRRCFDDSENYICGTRPTIFVTASQIALSAALIMGVAALATLLYRICTRPNLFAQSRYGGNGRESAFQRISRASLSSIQIRVLARLCDRPPKYETERNYTNRIQTNPSTATTPSPPQFDTINDNNSGPVSLPQICMISDSQPPPAYYDGTPRPTLNTLNELPPSYDETITTTTISEPTIGLNPMPLNVIDNDSNITDNDNNHLAMSSTSPNNETILVNKNLTNSTTLQSSSTSSSSIPTTATTSILSTTDNDKVVHM